ncbi:MAG: hypothetical protein DRP78_00475 [Candidatus Omnitrophota bacterium]|nr:MAG: hypothetical protein DRP78_00475 [Candidatus Omnitrophota bacterium]
MNIVVFQPDWGTAAPYVIESYVKAFRFLGHKVSSVSLKELADQSFVVNKIKSFSPDLSVFYALPLNQTNILEKLDALGIAYVSLFYDDPFIYLQQFGKDKLDLLKKSKWYCIFCSDTDYLQDLRKFGFLRVEYLPLAVDTDLFYPINAFSGCLEKFKCNLAFAGSVDTAPLAMRKNRMKRWQKFAVLNNRINELTDPENIIDAETLRRELNFLKTQMPWDIYAVFCRTVYEEVSSFLRIHLINAVSCGEINVYGNQGWLNLNNEYVVYKGTIDYKNELCCLYNAAAINLNITSPQLRTAVNQRVYDVCACSGFVLTDFRNDLSRLFGDLIVSYKNRNDLNSKIDYFLKHKQERDERAQKARQKVLAEHTYQHRAKVLIDAVSSNVIGLA